MELLGAFGAAAIVGVILCIVVACQMACMILSRCGVPGSRSGSQMLLGPRILRPFCDPYHKDHEMA